MLKINLAKYGKSLDVTDIIHSKILAKCDILCVENRVFGDPLPNIKKQLIITLDNGQECIYEEHAKINLTTLLPNIKSIKSARYGKYTDVTTIVRSKIQTGCKILEINNDTLGDAILKGIKQELIIQLDNKQEIICEDQSKIDLLPLLFDKFPSGFKLEDKITVFTSCYNQGEFLREAIESVLNQTHNNFEYFLYDDGSQDNTWSIIQEYARKDHRIIPIKLGKQPTLSRIINDSLKRYTGQIWSWCPSDDIWEKNLLEKKLEYHHKNPDAVLYNDCYIIDEKSQILRESKIPLYTPDEFRKLIWEKSLIWFTGIFIPKSVFDLVGGFPEHIKLSEDFYWTVKATVYNVDFINVPLTLHRKRKSGNQTSFRENSNLFDNMKLIWNELSNYKKRLIPRHIFFFWGNEQMSWMRYMTLKSFRLFNPDWKMILYVSKCTISNKPWTEEVLQDFFSFNGVNYYAEIKDLNIEIREWDLNKINVNENIKTTNISASQMSNFFKWYTLYEIGGFYSDLDIIYFKPIDKFYNELVNSGYDTAICETSYLSIGFLASAKNNKFFLDLFSSCFGNFDAKIYQTAGVWNISKLYGYQSLWTYGTFIDKAREKYPDLSFCNIPFNLVYPLDSNHIEYAFTTDVKINNLPSNTIGYHWYAAHPIAQKFNSLITKDNYINHNMTFCNIAREILKI